MNKQILFERLDSRRHSPVQDLLTDPTLMAEDREEPATPKVHVQKLDNGGWAVITMPSTGKNPEIQILDTEADARNLAIRMRRDIASDGKIRIGPDKSDVVEATIVARTDTPRRVWIKTQYGEPVVPKLKSIGARWDPKEKLWWVGASKRDDVEKLIGSSDPGNRDTSVPKTTNILGTATYKGKTYFILWSGVTSRGSKAYKLSFRDGKASFWADATKVTPGKTFRRPVTLSKLLSYKPGAARGGEDWSYRSDGEPGPVRGCGQCRQLGKMCDRCKFDEL